MTFSLNTSEEMGGKEVTRRFRLYRLYGLLVQGVEKGANKHTANHCAYVLVVNRCF